MRGTARLNGAPATSRTMRNVLVAGLATVVVLMVGMAAFAIAQPIQVLPRMALAPGFALEDQDGRRFTSEDLRGSIAIYAFAPASCDDRCAPIHSTMAEVARRLHTVDTGGAPVRLVTISLDPERDTPEALRTAASELGADGQVWRLVTGQPGTVKQVVGAGFEVFYATDPQGGVRFDPVFVVVDGWGIVRARHQFGIPDVDQVLDQLRRLGAEIRASSGIGRLAYEAAHLFACYAY